MLSNRNEPAHEVDVHIHTHPHHRRHTHPTRRGFFATFLENALVGAGVLQIAGYRAAWAQAQSATAPDTANLFEIEKIADGVYFAFALPSAMVNSNAAIFVNSTDLVVVDAHSKPSAAAALIAQIKREVTPKPVRYLIDTHFHFDHTQGNAAYLAAGNKVDIVATKTTKKLMSQLLGPRLRASLDPSSIGPRSGAQQVAHRLEDLRLRVGKATTAAEKAPLQLQIAQLEAFAAEMKNFEPTLPTITFDKSYVIKDKEHELHLEFHGCAHTAGDLQVFCPQKRVLATGDAYHPGFPSWGDSYPIPWPRTIDSFAKLAFDHILGGHGRAQHDRKDMTGQRNYIEELTERVVAGKKAGKTIPELQRTITVASLKSLHADGYMNNLAPQAMQRSINTQIDDMYDRIEKVSFTGSDPLRIDGPIDRRS